MRETPNFTGWHAAILHREDANTERLIRQLTLLGLRTSLSWEPIAAHALADMVIVDADQGWDGLLPWNNGPPPIPVIPTRMPIRRPAIASRGSWVSGMRH